MPPYQVQSSLPAEDQAEPEIARNVDQSKAPGFRGNSKSPVVDAPTTTGLNYIGYYYKSHKRLT